VPKKDFLARLLYRKLVKKTGCKDVIFILASPASSPCGMISSEFGSHGSLSLLFVMNVMMV